MSSRPNFAHKPTVFNFINLTHTFDTNNLWSVPQSAYGRVLLTGLYFPSSIHYHVANLIPIFSIWYCPGAESAWFILLDKCWQWAKNSLCSSQNSINLSLALLNLFSPIYLCSFIFLTGMLIAHHKYYTFFRCCSDKEISLQHYLLLRFFQS